MKTVVERNISNDGESEAMNNSKRSSIGSIGSDCAPWGQFQFAKRLSLLTPRYDVPGSDDEDEDMFTMYNWSNCSAKTDDEGLSCDGSRDGAGYYGREGRKHDHLRSYPAPAEGYQHQEPARPAGRAQRRSSMPMTSNWADMNVADEAPRVEAPRRSTGRTKRRSSMSMAYTAPEPSLNEEPEPRRRSRRRKSKEFEEDGVPSHPRRRAKRRTSMPMAYTVPEPAPVQKTYKEPRPRRNSRSSRALNANGVLPSEERAPRRHSQSSRALNTGGVSPSEERARRRPSQSSRMLNSRGALSPEKNASAAPRHRPSLRQSKVGYETETPAPRVRAKRRGSMGYTSQAPDVAPQELRLEDLHPAQQPAPRRSGRMSRRSSM